MRINSIRTLSICVCTVCLALSEYLAAVSSVRLTAVRHTRPFDGYSKALAELTVLSQVEGIQQIMQQMGMFPPGE